MREDEDPPIQPPERIAEELTALARLADDPAARIWYLQWAKAFDRLAEIGGRKRKDKGKPH
jgi:hypothetical protein